MLGDVVVPREPSDAVTPIAGDYAADVGLDASQAAWPHWHS